MGYKKPEAIQLMLQEYETDNAKITEEYIDAIHETFLQLMVDYYTDTNELEALPHAEEMMDYYKSKGVKIGMNTGFAHEITDVIFTAPQLAE